MSTSARPLQVIPHITNEIKEFVYSVGKKTNADVVITEVGGTTGDIESQPFIEAIRQIGLEQGRGNSLFIHVTLVPFLRGSDEHKTKPTQHSVKELQGMGISPDVIVLRRDEPLEDSIFRKIAMFCNVKPDCVIENLTLPNLYEAPLMLEANGLSSVVCRELGLEDKTPDLRSGKRWSTASVTPAVRSPSALSANMSAFTTRISPSPRRCTTADTSAARRWISAGSTARTSQRITSPRSSPAATE